MNVISVFGVICLISVLICVGCIDLEGGVPRGSGPKSPLIPCVPPPFTPMSPLF